MRDNRGVQKVDVLLQILFIFYLLLGEISSVKSAADLRKNTGDNQSLENVFISLFAYLQKCFQVNLQRI